MLRMIQRREDFGFALKPREPIGIVARTTRGSTLIATWRFSFVSVRAIHLAHAALADLARDFVDAEAGAGSEGQGAVIIRATERGFGPSTTPTPSRTIPSRGWSRPMFSQPDEMDVNEVLFRPTCQQFAKIGTAASCEAARNVTRKCHSTRFDAQRARPPEQMCANRRRWQGENVLLIVSAKLLRKTQEEIWRREWETLRPLSNPPVNTGISRATLIASMI